MQVVVSHVITRQFKVFLSTQQRLHSEQPDLLVDGDQISRRKAELSDNVVLVHLPSVRSDRAKLVITKSPAVNQAHRDLV